MAATKVRQANDPYLVLFIQKDDTFSQVITVKNSDDTNYDFTSTNVRLQLRETDGTLLDTLSSYGNGITLAAGAITILKDLPSMTVGTTYFFDLEFITSAEKVTKIKGELRCVAQVTTSVSTS